MDTMDEKGNSKELKDVEEVVVKDSVFSVDTTDKKSQQYKQSNTYAAKKTVAQGMMDVALITANANQLRYLIEYQRSSPTYYVIFSLIIVSLTLQVAVGVSLIFKGRFDIKGQSKSAKAQRINNCVVIGVFLITIINVFIAAFSITVPAALPQAAERQDSNLLHAYITHVKIQSRYKILEQLGKERLLIQKQAKSAE